MKKIFSVILSLLLFFSMPLLVFSEIQVADSEKQAILSALYEADIESIRNAIDAKIITCEELTEYYLERIEKFNKDYNCFITICDDAIQIARERDVQLSKGENGGLLFGIPVVIKDNINLAGYYTTNGHNTTRLSPASENAKVVDYLLEQGAVVIGKTNMSTDAQDARTSYSQIIGETKNAYNTWLSAGGSSGGTAVAVSQNFAVAGLGTDTNSSLRIPAVLNGCISLRPTLKLIPCDGCTTLNSNRDVVGAITRSVHDQAILLDVLTAGEFSYTQNLNDNAFENKRIGILSELTYPISPSTIQTNNPEIRKNLLKDFGIYERVEKNFDTEVSTAFNSTVEELKSSGAEVVVVSLPNLFDLAYSTFTSSKVTHKTDFYNSFKQFMEDNNLDAVIFPTYLSAPLKTGKDNNGKVWNVWQNQVFLNNCRFISPSTGMPEVSITIGYHSTGAGIGMEILADKNCEQILLDMAYTYTGNNNHRIPPSGAPNLYINANQGDLQQIIDKYTTPAISQEEISQELVSNEKSNSLSIIIIIALTVVAVLSVFPIIIFVTKEQ